MTYRFLSLFFSLIFVVVNFHLHVYYPHGISSTDIIQMKRRIKKYNKKNPRGM